MKISVPLLFGKPGDLPGGGCSDVGFLQAENVRSLGVGMKMPKTSAKRSDVGRGKNEGITLLLSSAKERRRASVRHPWDSRRRRFCLQGENRRG